MGSALPKGLKLPHSNNEEQSCTESLYCGALVDPSSFPLWLRAENVQTIALFNMGVNHSSFDVKIVPSLVGYHLRLILQKHELPQHTK